MQSQGSDLVQMWFYTQFLNDFNNLRPVHCAQPGNEARILQELNSME